MPKTRVLVVDDAVVVRRLVSDALSSAPGIEVAGTAPNGRIALSKIPQVNPDIITLDVEMPIMDGIETLTAIRKSYPDLPVIMFSTLTERGTKVTMEALLLGANDYVTKPANVGGVQESVIAIREQLVPKIHALCGNVGLAATSGAAAQANRPAPRRQAAAKTPPRRPRTTTAPIDIVVIGVSTGGPNALADVLPALPGDLGVPVVIVQHMPPMFTKLLAERLNNYCRLPVREARQGTLILPDQIYIAPGDHHLELRQRGPGVVAALTKDPPENSCRPAADVLFRTAAKVYGAGCLGVVLTGMGYDARRGAQHIVEVGGHVMAQDKPTSVVWGMPGAVVEDGTADEVLPLGAVAERITARVRRSHSTGAGRQEARA